MMGLYSLRSEYNNGGLRGYEIPLNKRTIRNSVQIYIEEVMIIITTLLYFHESWTKPKKRISSNRDEKKKTSEGTINNSHIIFYVHTSNTKRGELHYYTLSEQPLNVLKNTTHDHHDGWDVFLHEAHFCVFLRPMLLYKDNLLSLCSAYLISIICKSMAKGHIHWIAKNERDIIYPA